MHKAAGTSLCKLASLQGEQFSSISDHRAHIDLIHDSTSSTNAPNLNLINNPDPSHLIHFIQQLRREHVTFVSTEHWFPATTITHLKAQLEVKFITILRHPVERLISSYFYHKGDGHRIDTTTATQTVIDSELTFASTILTYATTCSNMYVRLLNGDVFGPKYFPLDIKSTQQKISDLTSKDLNKAIQMIKQFDAIEILELHDNFEEIVHAMHWTKSDVDHHYNAASKYTMKERHSILKRQIGSDDWYDQLMDLNQWDMQLYEWAIKNRPTTTTANTGKSNNTTTSATKSGSNTTSDEEEPFSSASDNLMTPSPSQLSQSSISPPSDNNTVVIKNNNESSLSFSTSPTKLFHSTTETTSATGTPGTSEHKIIKKNSENLIICFGGRALKMGGILPFEFLNYLSKTYDKNTDLYFYIDKHQCW